MGRLLGLVTSASFCLIMADKVGVKKRQGQGGRAAETPMPKSAEPMRIAKAIAHAGLCSRRDAETWIGQGRVAVNGKVLTTPAVVVAPGDKVTVDGKPLPETGLPRLWRYNKPKGLVTSHKDPQGRKTVFEALPAELPRVVSVGRLDLNTEGLLLLTTDGALARHLELPSTGWLRRYRVRAHGRVTQADLDRLAKGITLDGVHYGPVEATIDREQGTNMWLNLSLREGKNREVKRLAESLGLIVNRLIRISFGPFALGDLAPGTVSEVKPRVLRDQLGAKLADELGLGSAGERRRAARAR
jgi:23S rRNA pseudouridine2605 synthase